MTGCITENITHTHTHNEKVNIRMTNKKQKRVFKMIYINKQKRMVTQSPSKQDVANVVPKCQFTNEAFAGIVVPRKRQKLHL